MINISYNINTLITDDAGRQDANLIGKIAHHISYDILLKLVNEQCMLRGKPLWAYLSALVRRPLKTFVTLLGDFRWHLFGEGKLVKPQRGQERQAHPLVL